MDGVPTRYYVQRLRGPAPAHWKTVAVTFGPAAAEQFAFELERETMRRGHAIVTRVRTDHDLAAEGAGVIAEAEAATEAQLEQLLMARGKVDAASTDQRERPTGLAQAASSAQTSRATS